MEPEITLFFVFFTSIITIKFFKGKLMWKLAGQIAMSAMLIVTSIGHILYFDGMVSMIPPIIPFKREIVYLTGLFEFACAIALFVPSIRKYTAWFLMVFLILILPANIYAAVNTINIETATQDGDGLGYLWYRVPLQLFYVLWVYFSVIYKKEIIKK